MTERGRGNSRKWIPIDIPTDRRLGLPGLVQACEWRMREEKGRLLVCTEEKYRGARATLIRPHRLLDATNTQDDEPYRRVASWPSQDRYTILWNDVAPRITKIIETKTREGFWQAFQLVLMAAPDAEVVRHLREMLTEVILPQMPRASLWALEIAPPMLTRFHAIRVLFSVNESPEILDRSRQDFGGFQAGRGLQPHTSFGYELFVQPALLFGAPWLYGITSARVGGVLALMFGRAEPGRHAIAAELMDLYLPRGLTKADLTTEQMPEHGPEELEASFRWWSLRLNDLMGLILDPANFPDAEGVYDPRAHFGLALTLERLFAVAVGILVHSRRDEYTRKLLFFDALDLLQGLRQGDYRALLSSRKVDRRLHHIREQLPEQAAAVVLPRLERGASALREMRQGFHLRERLVDGGLRVRTKQGDWQTIPLDHAVADYLRVVRNSTHTFEEVMDDPREASLLASHDGELPATLPDVAMIHILYLLMRPGVLVAHLVE